MVALNVKKVYCPKCQKLRRIKEQKSAGKLQFSCIQCDQTVWQKEGNKWKYTKPE